MKGSTYPVDRALHAMPFLIVVALTATNGYAQTLTCNASRVERIELEVQRERNHDVGRIITMRHAGTQEDVPFVHSGGPYYWLDLTTTGLKPPYVPGKLKLEAPGSRLDSDPRRRVTFDVKDGRCVVVEPVFAFAAWDIEISTDVEAEKVYVLPEGCTGKACERQPTKQYFWGVLRSQPFQFTAVLAPAQAPDRPIPECVVVLPVEVTVDSFRLNRALVEGKVPPSCNDYLIWKGTQFFLPRGGIVVRNVTMDPAVVRPRRDR